MSGLNKILNSAQDDRDDSIEIGGEDNQKINLYRNVTDRPTEHVLQFNDEDVEKEVTGILEEMDNIEYDYEDSDTIRVKVSQ
jgi:hypothetical protein